MACKALLIWTLPTPETCYSPNEIFYSSNIPYQCSLGMPCHAASHLCSTHSVPSLGMPLPYHNSFLSCWTHSRYHLLWKYFWSSPAWVSFSTLRLLHNLRPTSIIAILPWAQNLISLILVSSSVKYNNSLNFTGLLG